MDSLLQKFRELEKAGFPFLENFLNYLPHLLGAVLLLVLGWILAGLARSGVLKLTHALYRLINRLLVREGAVRLQVSGPVLDLLSKVLFWVVFLFFVKFAAHMLMLTAVSDWLDQVVSYLPTFVAGGVILVAGGLLSVLARDLTVAAAVSANLPQSRLLGMVVQGATLITALVIGLDQIGIDVSFLSTLIAIIVAALLGSLALAFGLGARSFVSNLIGAHFLQQQYRPGQRVRLSGYEGVVLEFTPTAVVLATDEGRLILPAKLFHDESSLLVIPKDADE